jgi:hypothetical protein
MMEFQEIFTGVQGTVVPSFTIRSDLHAFLSATLIIGLRM